MGLAILGLLALVLVPSLLHPTPTAALTTPSASPLPPTATLSPTADPLQPTATLFVVAPQSTPINALTPNAEAQSGLAKEGLIILSMRDGARAHLFAYHPLFLPLTRLTDGDWDDITPSVSPDGSRIAFSSNRSGHWDLYILNVQTSQVTQLTDTSEYDASPSWSPDGQWIVFESYVPAGNLEIIVRSVTDPAADPIQLTDNPAADHSPVWSPGGREIAFVSSRTGNDEIWMARLDNLDERFIDVSGNASSSDLHPAWSPDDRFLAWSADTEDGNRSVVIWDREKPDFPPLALGNGTWPTWSPDGSLVISQVSAANQAAVSSYRVDGSGLAYPLTNLPGMLYGLDWKAGALTGLLQTYHLPANAQAPAAALWQAVLDVYPAPVNGRVGVIELLDLLVPYPYLSDAVDESFNALRQQVAQEAGWDVLANLQNAFVPITNPVMPMLEEDWLATGRAVQISPMALQAGWMVIVREDYAGQTYWRVYVKARFQDGSQGAPLTRSPWDLDARYSSSTIAFEQGGQYGPIPAGYWVDLTEIALRYGWERLPSLMNWRSYYNGVRFNQLVLRSGLDWYSAMRQIYPIEAIQTPTAIPTPTRTPQPTATVPFKVIATNTSQPIQPTRTPGPSLTPAAPGTRTP